MSNLIKDNPRRQTDQPLPVYKGNLQLYELEHYAAINSATKVSFRTADGVRESVSFHSQTFPNFNWFQSVPSLARISGMVNSPVLRGLVGGGLA